jgi:hypothetical protein
MADEALKRFDERTAKRRAKAKEHEDEAQELIREAEARRDRDKPAE